MAKKYDKSSEDDILSIYSHIIVSARVVKHIMWELQPYVNRLAEYDLDNETLRKWESLLFNQSETVMNKISTMYSVLPEYMRRSVDDFTVHPVRDAYDNVKNLEEVDSYIKKTSLICKDKITKNIDGFSP